MKYKYRVFPTSASEASFLVESDLDLIYILSRLITDSAPPGFTDKETDTWYPMHRIDKIKLEKDVEETRS